MGSLVLAGGGVAQDLKIAGSLSIPRSLALVAMVPIVAVLLGCARMPGASYAGPLTR